MKSAEQVVSPSPPVELETTVLNGGVCREREAFIVPSGRWTTVDIPALFALVHHPTQGVGLFDTGYATRFHQATESFPYRLYRMMTPVRVEQKDNAVAQLSERGVAASDVRWILLSHFDPDHIGGLRDFPSARVFCKREAWQAVKGKRGLAAMRLRLLPDLLPADLADRLELIENIDGPPVGPFSATHDLFGDGSIRVVELPGHAPGHLGAWIRVREGKTWLLAADACWSRAAIRAGRSTVHRFAAHNRKAQDGCYEILQTLLRDHPDVTVVPSHCPETAEELVASGTTGG